MRERIKALYSGEIFIPNSVVLSKLCYEEDARQLEKDYAELEVENEKLRENIGFCEWKLEEPDFDTYETGCGEVFISLGGSPLDNSLKYCCYCGKLLKEVCTPLEQYFNKDYMEALKKAIRRSGLFFEDYELDLLINIIKVII